MTNKEILSDDEILARRDRDSFDGGFQAGIDFALNNSVLNFADATVIQSLIEDVQHAETALHRANVALANAMKGLVFDGLQRETK